MTNWFVSPTGSDSNNGRSALQPFATFAAADLVAQPGDTVNIGIGAYNLTSQIVTSASGTADKPITWTTGIRRPWLNTGPTNNAYITSTLPQIAQWLSKGNYVIIDGIEFTDIDASSAISMWGHDCKMTRHYVHDIGTANSTSVPGGGLFDRANIGAANNEIAYNFVLRCGPQSAVSSVFHNIYVSGPYDFIHHNISGQAGGWCIQSSDDTSPNPFNHNQIFANNLMFNGGEGGFALGTTATNPADYIYCINNISINHTGSTGGLGEGFRETGTTGTHNIYDHNLTNGNVLDYRLQNGNVATNQINGPPSFVNYQSDGSGDYHQIQGSNGIDSGTGLLPSYNTLWNWSQDLDGSLVPLGVGWDCGPYEFIAAHGGVAIFDQTTGLAVFGGIAGGITPFFLHGKSDNAGIADVGEQLYVYDSNNPGQFGPQQYGQIWAGNVDPFTRQGDSVWGAVHEGDLWFNDNPLSSSQNTRIGPTNNPGSAANWYSGSGTQKWIQWLASLTGTITSISFYADGDGSTSAGFYGCVWSATGTLLGNTSIGHFSGGARHIGQQHWHTLSGISVPVTSGTTYIIGFQNDNSSVVDWSCYSSLSSTYSGFGYNTQSTFPGNLGTAFTPFENLPMGVYFVVQTTTGTQAHISICRNGAWVTIVA